MNHIKIASQTQADIHVFEKIDEFCDPFRALFFEQFTKNIS